jgi:hypothetical protein
MTDGAGCAGYGGWRLRGAGHLGRGYRNTVLRAQIVEGDASGLVEPGAVPKGSRDSVLVLVLDS